MSIVRLFGREGREGLVMFRAGGFLFLYCRLGRAPKKIIKDSRGSR